MLSHGLVQTGFAEIRGQGSLQNTFIQTSESWIHFQQHSSKCYGENSVITSCLITQISIRLALECVFLISESFLEAVNSVLCPDIKGDLFPMVCYQIQCLKVTCTYQNQRRSWQESLAEAIRQHHMSCRSACCLLGFNSQQHLGIQYSLDSTTCTQHLQNNSSSHHLLISVMATVH